MAKDKVFGQIKWTDDVWEGTLSVPYFRGSGERIELTAADRKELPRSGECVLNIETGDDGERRPPSEPQRSAFQKMLERRDALWDEAMDDMCAAYRKQRAQRVRYWNVLHGKRGLSRSLPAKVNRAVMKEMVLPLWCRVQRPEVADQPVDIFLTLLATWWSESINVYVRDGRVIEITPHGFFPNRSRPSIQTTTFGTLRRRRGARTPWLGEVQIEPFRSFAALAVDRSFWDQSYTRKDDGTSDLPWHVARGSANLFVYAERDNPPTERQAAVFESFIHSRDRYSAAIINAVFSAYRKQVGMLRKRGDSPPPKPQKVPMSPIDAFLMERNEARDHVYRGAERDAALPILKDPQGLQDITELSEMDIFPDDGKRSVAIGFVFQGTWTGDSGVGVRWRDGKVEQVGGKEVAVPQGFK